MKLEDQDGKEIKELIWIATAPDGTTDYQRRKPEAHERIYLSYEYHGDHAQLWAIVEKAATGVEVMRYNIRNVDTIDWA